MTSGSSMLAITRSLPPQCRQRSISMAKTRFKRCAQVIARWRSASVLSADVSRLTPELGTTRERSALAGAKTP